MILWSSYGKMLWRLEKAVRALDVALVCRMKNWTGLISNNVMFWLLDLLQVMILKKYNIFLFVLQPVEGPQDKMLPITLFSIPVCVFRRPEALFLGQNKRGSEKSEENCHYFSHLQRLWEPSPKSFYTFCILPSDPMSKSVRQELIKVSYEGKHCTIFVCGFMPYFPEWWEVWEKRHNLPFLLHKGALKTYRVSFSFYLQIWKQNTMEASRLSKVDSKGIVSASESQTEPLQSKLKQLLALLHPAPVWFF